MKKEQTNETRQAIEVKDFRAYNPGKGPLRGFAVVRIGNVVVKDVQLLEYKEGDFSIAMPQVKGKDKDGNEAWYPLVWFDLGSKEANKHCYEDICAAVLKFYPG